MTKERVWTAEEVIARVGKYMNAEHVEMVVKACHFATIAHQDQIRQSGEPYIMHPIQVAGILADLNMDPETVSAGFLHDIVEDTGVTLSDVRELFGDDVALIVDGVTKLGKIKYKSNKEQLAENHRKLLLAMSKDIRVMIVKLADRLHNMRTLEHLRPDKQRRIANETLEIYAPLADRLGISTIKWELEDISLRYLNPQQYYRIVHLMNSRRDQREQYIAGAIQDIKESIKDLKLDPEIYGRPKHIYSVYRKMKDQHKQFSQIYDLLAIRVIVDTIKDCYAVLGAIHSQWKPMPGRFKDYIAMPKANMYQSLHTTVIGPEGKPLEVQIRTKEMHAVAEYGVAAHWAYKEGVTDKVQETNSGDKLNLFKHIIELQEDTDDASDFMDSVKGELFGDHVYAFTPKGDVLELPKGAGPLDMAYAIHTEVGHHTTGATINGKIVPLNYEIKNGDIVDIRTSSSSAGPSRDWLKLVSTRRARNKIKQFFRAADREQNIVSGQEAVEHTIRDLGYDPKGLMTKDNLDKVTAKMHYQHADDLLAAIGFGDLQPRGVANRLTEGVRKAEEDERRRQEERELLEEHQTIKNDAESEKKDRKQGKDSDGVVIEGVDNLLIRLSHCCSPVPGDDIVGYITKGRGVSVHRKDCPNVRNAEKNGERLVDVRWGNKAGDKTNYNADIEVQGYNRNGLLNDVLRTINNNTKYLTSINGKVDHNKMATISISLGTRGQIELQRILDNIKNIPDVYVVKRAFH
ncbi:MAG: bifunctional (p)ppGpp synthetase/guanosine-3',5'-bis(diphosphate) 3'-pyrophosphohydrolase [Levilactobacillus sp.]|jgi:GTP pyrophosphokinase|uniref:GTP diphosphokinase n=1 Tax=Levilactobacillus suantsaiihabitans TaxID=2487722 RepID=A0A4Z0JBW5_9LACO|nr:MULTISPECIES: bifunctional (p)ppGpp synthetase/guanosine-3',5'-bis(diphosphate) 3'-pyrophosphohydrolase [Levilactobacillus]MCH4123261.1 bifunctional (p)ppGpp synthetase/guanosine-3',5'-bis(diphosphate) 3'-pyrophosphohydrolase [Levilactobacillus sp.]MCI1552601.1 bifunctional (p)ppGpp synthetase/guanosine-3',5'-bis(diphosphate) 3'-pyrophosphohydrolase [Levilactobacillus sp.]MCI1599346.1 bifunctional (p)ppGpp synthetase/guanosine-3',5'-bis(diphosphate) 3'-pyrophosphohydrolase [Levilactobacillus 